MMEKPFVVCHMLSSVDGRIDGGFMSAPENAPAGEEYGKLRGFYGCQATLYGTVTMEGSYAEGLAGELPHSDIVCTAEDFVAPSDVKNYIVSVDPKGVLGWNSCYIEKKGRPRAHVIEVLTEQVSSDYLAYLRGFGISYIFAGKEQLDCELVLHKLKTLFGIERLMIAGGGIRLYESGFPAGSRAGSFYIKRGEADFRRCPVAAVFAETVKICIISAHGLGRPLAITGLPCGPGHPLALTGSPYVYMGISL